MGTSNNDGFERNKPPLVSIVIPSYKAAYFEQALKSAIGQTYSNIEIIVSDNCPTEAIRDICAKYEGVKYYRSDVYRTDNVIGALFRANGKYVKPLFDDDLLHPFCVERMVNEMEKDGNIELVFSASSVIDADNRRKKVRKPFGKDTVILHHEFVRRMVLGFDNFVGEYSSVLFRGATLGRIGKEDILKWQGVLMDKGLTDVVFFLNITQHGLCSYLDEELSYFRLDHRTMSNSNPSVNPDFAYAASDWLNILRLAEKPGYVSFADVKRAMGAVKRLVKKHGRHPQVKSVVNDYIEYVGGRSFFDGMRLNGIKKLLRNSQSR